MESEAIQGASAPPQGYDEPGDMPAAAALFQIAASHGAGGRANEISAESGLDDARLTAGWRTLRELELVRLSGGVVWPVDCDTALRILVGSYTSYARAQLHNVGEANEAAHMLLNVFGRNTPAQAAPCPEPADTGRRPVVVERYTGPGSRERALRDTAGSLRASLDSLHRGPLPSDRAILDTQLELVAGMAGRGIRMRALHSPAMLREPACARYLASLTDLGVRVRLVDRVALDLLIVDRDTLCLTGAADDGPSSRGGGVVADDTAMVRIHGSALTPSFQALFDAYWRLAAPFVPPSGGRLPVRGPQLSTFERAVVRLMSCGYDDGRIARELGVAPQAVADVVDALVQRLGAASRFEAGFRLGRALDAGRLP
ncbi:hypothetical protein [Actinacidiphila acidipaludis]|uniref:HTH luxR-type domain-containing protein n=1 Tax=Actinacidiphila acidipaludis TaxID=2873382 RepID=A0ABS7Q9J0_9ACTN|nr:hypothetical protein [Streptomyces acidipaludis]MBY8879777.1 hypothetical protein [Streptomyces acidipaludis]